MRMLMKMLIIAKVMFSSERSKEYILERPGVNSCSHWFVEWLDHGYKLDWSVHPLVLDHFIIVPGLTRRSTSKTAGDLCIVAHARPRRAGGILGRPSQTAMASLT
jgi:hypothetical protein